MSAMRSWVILRSKRRLRTRSRGTPSSASASRCARRSCSSRRRSCRARPRGSTCRPSRARRPPRRPRTRSPRRSRRNQSHVTVPFLSVAFPFSCPVPQDRRCPARITDPEFGASRTGAASLQALPNATIVAKPLRPPSKASGSEVGRRERARPRRAERSVLVGRRSEASHPRRRSHLRRSGRWPDRASQDPPSNCGMPGSLPARFEKPTVPPPASAGRPSRRPPGRSRTA